MSDRCPTNVKYEFHGMDMDIYKNFSPSEEYKMTEYEKGVQHGIIVGRRSVEPKHGRWIWRGGNLCECSECGAIVVAQDYIPIELYRFCRGCGAQMMDGGEE